MKFLLSLFIACAVMLLPTAPLLAQAGDDLPSFPGRILQVGTIPVNGTDEIQTITIGGTPTGGTFKLRFQGRTTAAITWSSTNATLVSNIDTALEALSTIGSAGVTTAVGTMTAGIGTITVTFSGTNVKRLAVSTMTVANNSMTGTAPTCAVAETTPGVTADGRSTIKGTLAIDVTNGVLYQNQTTTANTPVWGKVGAQ